jgi:two-component system, cell cycle response regulator
MNKAAENIIPFFRQNDEPLTILVVEDNRLERAFIEEHVRELGHNLVYAEDGQQALNTLANNKDAIDVVLMDRMMPVMDGLTAIRRMKDDPELKKIPVVMVTAASSADEMQEGLDADVFYYLTKPVDEKILRSVLIAAVREAHQNRALHEELAKHKTGFNLIQTCKFHLHTLEEAECLAAFAAHCFPEPEQVLRGLAELMFNAVEHGNLEIGYERKTELLNDGTWRAEIQRRMLLDKYQDKNVEVVITRKNNGVYAVITDQGQGFNWKRYMTIDPSRAGDNHGRGIAQANIMSFDKLTYNEKGNQAVAFVGETKQLEW